MTFTPLTGPTDEEVAEYFDIEVSEVRARHRYEYEYVDPREVAREMEGDRECDRRRGT